MYAPSTMRFQFVIQLIKEAAIAVPALVPISGMCKIERSGARYAHYGASLFARTISRKDVDLGKNRIDFIDVCRKFHHAMLVTHNSHNDLQSWPVIVASVGPNGEFWFAIDRNLLRQDDIKPQSKVCVTMTRDGEFATVSGEAEVRYDAAGIKQFWCESWRPWFADGPTDLALTLVHLDAHFGETWSRDRSTRFKHFFAVREPAAMATENSPAQRPLVKVQSAKAQFMKAQFMKAQSVK